MDKKRDQIWVNAIKWRKFINKVLLHMHGKLEENVYMNKKRKKSFNESPLVCVYII